jgi:hypothetical protein
MPSITVRDETRPGRAAAELVLDGLPDRLTVGELIRWRVREEVAAANLDRARVPRLLVQPTPEEAAANGPPRPPRPIDWERQARVAEEAFERNGFFLLVDGRQVEELDEEVELGADTDVRFLRLVPLVGG